MFKYQDLIYTKSVGSSWSSAFGEWMISLGKSISETKPLQNQISNNVKQQDLTTGEITEATLAMEGVAKLQNLTRTLYTIFENNREWHKGMIKKHEEINLPRTPVQYTLDKYFINEFSDNANKVIKDFRKESLDTIEKLFINTNKSTDALPRGKDYYKVEEFVDTLREKMNDVLDKNQLSFSRPTYNNLWLYMGEIDDDENPNTFQGLHVLTYDEEQWDTVDFHRDYFRKNKFVLQEDEFVVSIDHYSMLKVKGEEDSYFKDGHSYVHFNKDHKPIDVLTYLPDDDILDEWMRVVYKSLDDSFGFRNIDTSTEHDNLAFLLTTYCHREVGYILIRTYLVLELFSILNTRNNQLAEGETVLVERPAKDFVNTKKARKRIKSKLGIDVLDEFFVVKELVINPLLTTETNADSIYSPNDGPIKLREHMRAGHYKVYSPDRPRFGVNHKNNIGRFWYNPSTVAKNSNKGLVVKDYKVEK